MDILSHCTCALNFLKSDVSYLNSYVFYAMTSQIDKKYNVYGIS